MAGAGVGAECAGFGTGGFLAAGGVDDADADAVVGLGGGVEVAAAGGGVGREAVAVEGSGVMMLTAGVELALGNSALVGLPVGTPGMRALGRFRAPGELRDILPGFLFQAGDDFSSCHAPPRF